ncbi:alpha/beta hydrolase [Staphylospora marina]|uniref:alpha/beta hydrolase n=1 Tax=Staphylospora marina TaxID=2490858 RepID=UPI000F5BC7E3|nr:alpha/beta fold hydrolase [Staphylospora marina]
MKTVVRSPEPFFYPEGKTGILLIHGFSGTPSELRPMGEYFKSRGFTVYAPLLPGHGTSPEDMEKTGWKDWWQAVLDAHDRMMREDLDHLFVAGLSMGGVLSLMLAAERPVHGVISMCAPVWIRDRRAFLADLVKYVYRFKPRSVHRDPEIEAHLVPYDRTPVKCVGELLRLIRRMKKKLPEVKVPALVVQAARDELILEKSAHYILDHLGSSEKRLKWYEKSTHIITVDKERMKLFRDVEAFVRTVTGSGEPRIGLNVKER